MYTSSVSNYRSHTLLESFLGFIKLLSFIGSALIAALLISNSLHVDFKSLVKPKDPSIVVSVPVTYLNFPDVGKVFTPHIKANIITEDQNHPTTFLIDSGAKISALPMKYVNELGIDTSRAKRIYLRSATNNTTYGYLTEITIQFANSDPITIPVTFAEIIEPLLGTYGFFDAYSIIFDAESDTITIKTKG